MREEDSSYQLPAPFEQAVQNWVAATIAAGTSIKNRESHNGSVKTIKRRRPNLISWLERGSKYIPLGIYNHRAESDSYPHVGESGFPSLYQRVARLKARITRS